MTLFPGALDTFVNPTAYDQQDAVAVPHADQHANANDAIAALEAKVGIDGSGDAASLDSLVGQAVREFVNPQTGLTYTYVEADLRHLVTHSNAGAIAGTLPEAGAGGEFEDGWWMDVQNRGAGTLTITPTTSTIDGAATLVLSANQGARIVSDGTNYWTMRGIGGAASNPPVVYVADPNTELLTPADPAQPCIAYSADGTLAMFGWNVGLAVWQ